VNFFEYLGVPRDEFEAIYIETDLVQRQKHDTLPLDIYCYGRKAVQDDVWDGVTSKCRGIVVHRETGEIIARPFEKFHNYGSKHAGDIPAGQPTVMEKVDGFMVTAFKYEGEWYAASKGSFHSIHAKWATAELRKHEMEWPSDHCTPVFEGLHKDLRIVIDYGDFEGLVLLAIIDNEHGGEYEYQYVKSYALANGFEVADQFSFTLDAVVAETAQENAGDGDEGYVLTWYGDHYHPPFRLKLKYIDYLRLHRLVTGVSPKRIWEALSTPGLAADIDEYLNNSTPWFKDFTRKWIHALRSAFDEIKGRAQIAYQDATAIVRQKYDRGELEFSELRKAYALEFTKPENKEISSILFSELDGKNVDAVIWKKVKGMTQNGHPLREAQFT
jgi:RNA ligase